MRLRRSSFRFSELIKLWRTDETSALLSDINSDPVGFSHVLILFKYMIKQWNLK